jgi:predicted nucleic acid-binding protein
MTRDRRAAPLVLDASVLVELLIDGAHRAAADRLLDRIRDDGDFLLVTAAHGVVEAAHALRRLVRQGVLSDDDGAAAVRGLGQLDLVLDPTSPRLPVVWRLRDRMSAYDAAYAAAADALGLPLITTDDRLRRTCESEGIACQHLREVFTV